MKRAIITVCAMGIAAAVFGQFEKPQLDSTVFEKVTVKVGADFALQLQALSHEAPNSTVELFDLPKNFNLPTANLSIAADLAPGVRVYINNFMSSRHHNDAWVEGGYMLIDKLPFLPASDDIMENFTIKAGVFNPNFGDSHFYRSTNAAIMSNPFVGNWIMDNYTTNPGLEIMYRNKGMIAMLGTNNGRLNYGSGNDLWQDLVFNWKVGYDSEITEDLRIRATVSGYHVPDGHVGSYLWDGDRAGGRYYSVMDTIPNNYASNSRTGRWSPGSGQSKLLAIQGALTVQYDGIEFFGFYDYASGVRRGNDQLFNQIGTQLKYQYKSVYGAVRYNLVSDNAGSTVNRFNIGGGWFMTGNVLIKLEYVVQNYAGPAFDEGAYNIDGGSFSGLVLEAGISL